MVAKSISRKVLCISMAFAAALAAALLWTGQQALATSQTGDDSAVVVKGQSSYTVEFTYNGKQYVMQGGTTVPLADVLAGIGISGEVSDVKTSSLSLFSVQLQDGTWIVAAHKPFTSTEWMRVTAGGVEHQIVVTDAIRTGWFSANQLSTGDILSNGGLLISPNTHGTWDNDWLRIREMNADGDGYNQTYYAHENWPVKANYQVTEVSYADVGGNPRTWFIHLKKVNMITGYPSPQSLSMTYGEDHSTEATSLSFQGGTSEKSPLLTYQIGSQKDSSGGDVNYFSVPNPVLQTTPQLQAASDTPAGTYAVVVNAMSFKVEEDGDDYAFHSLSLPATINVTVGKADMTPTVNFDSIWTYGESPMFPIDADSPGNGQIESITITNKEGTAAWNSEELPKAAGEYTLAVTVEETANYNSGTGSKDFTIHRQAVAPAYDNVTFSPSPAPGDVAPAAEIKDAQGNTIPEAEYEVVPNIAEHTVTIKDKMTGSTYAENGNYDIAEATLSYDWKPVPTIDSAPTAADLTYNGVDQALLAAPGTATNGTLLYALGTDATTEPADADAWKSGTESLIGKEAGDYFVWYKATGDGENYLDSNPVCLTVTIAPDEALKAVEEKIDALPDAANVTVSDKAAIEEARAAYEALNDDQKSSIQTTGRLTKLDNDEVALEAALLAQAKQEAKAALDTKYDGMLSAPTFTESEKADLKDAYDEAAAAIEAATVLDSQAEPKENGPWKAEQAGEAALDAVQAIHDAREAAKAALDAKYTAMVDSGAYDDAGKAELKDAYDEAVAAIQAAIVPDSQVEPQDNGPWKAEQAGEAALDAVKTALQTAREAAKAALDAKYDAMVDSGAYDDAGKAELKDVRDEAAAAIEAATVLDSQAEPKDNGPWKAEQDGETALDAVKTKAQKDLETGKAEAKAALDAKYDEVLGSAAFTDSEKAELKVVYDEAVAAIEAATVPDSQAEPKDNGPWKAEQAGEAALDVKRQEISERIVPIQAAAKAALDEKYTAMKGSGDYDDAGLAQLKNAYDAAVAAIEAATVLDAKDDPQAGGAWQAEKDGEAALNAVPRSTNSLIPQSDDDAATLADKQVTFNGRKWYIIEDNPSGSAGGTITLLSADKSFGHMKYAEEATTNSNFYRNSKIKAYLVELVATGDFKDVADAMVDTENGKIYLLSTDEVERLPYNIRTVEGGDDWWTRTPQTQWPNQAVRDVQGNTGRIYYDRASVVTNNELVRPGLQLDKTAVAFDAETKTFTLRTHEHDIAYTSDGAATITATCTNYEGKCSFPEHKATLTIVAPTLTTYGQIGEGISEVATITDEHAIQGDAAVVYYKANDDGTDKAGDALAGAPTAAGVYWAEITLGSGDNAATAHVTYTIEVGPATPTATATYGQTLADVELPSGWTWADATQSVGTVGERTFKANYAPVTPEDEASSNPKSDVDVTVTVVKADPVAAAPMVAAPYGQALSNVALPNPAGNTPGTWTWVDGSQNVGEAGENTRKANFTPSDTDNYNTKDDVDVTVMVAKSNFGNVSFTLDPSEASYTGNPIEPKVTGTLTFATGEGQTTFTLDPSDYTVVYENNTDIGTATAIVTSTDTNITAGTTNLEFAIKFPEKNNVTVRLADWAARTQASTPEVTADFGADTAKIEYKVKDADDGTYTETVPTEPGEYTVRASVAGTDTYPAGQGTANFKITDSVKFTFIGSSVDDHEFAEPYTVYLPKGSSRYSLSREQEAAIVEHFTEPGYAPYEGRVFAISKPFSSYSDWDPVYDDLNDTSNKDRYEDTTFYLFIAKAVETVELSVVKPKCGTEVTVSNYNQTPTPQITLISGDVELPDYGDFPDGEYYNIDEQGDIAHDDPLFSGTLEGGKQYSVWPSVLPKFGYDYAADPAPNITVEGADPGSIRLLYGQEIIFTVTPEHVWGEPTWAWSDDHLSATAAFACTSCGHTERADAAVTSEQVGGQTLYTATATFQGKSYTETHSDKALAEFTYSLSLEDCIDINFYAKDLAGEPSKYTVSYGPGEEGSAGWTDKVLTRADENKIVVAGRAAKEMGDEVHVVVKYDGKVIKDARYSVRGYCDAVIGAGKYDAGLVDLCKATLDYGRYAQEAFGYNAENPVNGGKDYTSWGDVTVPDYDAKKDDRSEAVTGVTLSLVTTSKTQLVARFKTTATSPDGFSATVDGVEVPGPLTIENGKIKVAVTGIAAKDLDVKKEIKVTAPDGTYTFTVSPVDYMGLAVSKDSQVELNRAFYNYHLKAKAYQGPGAVLTRAPSGGSLTAATGL